MTIPTVTIPAAVLASDFPTSADRTAGTFNAKAVAWAGSENAMATRTREIAMAALSNALVANQAATEANATASTVAASAAAAAQSVSDAAYQASLSAASANQKGNWISLTGALNKPASVVHEGKVWALLRNLGDVTASQPRVSADWLDITALRAPGPIGGIIFTYNDVIFGISFTVGSATYLRTGVLSLKADFPSFPISYRFKSSAPNRAFGSASKFPPYKVIAYGNGIAIASSQGVAALKTSDGITWVGAGGATLAGSIVFGAGVFVISSSSSSSIVETTTNGVSWAQRTLPSSAPWGVSEYNSGQFVAVSTAASATVTAKSVDGLTWVSGGPTPAHSGSWSQPQRVGSNWVMVDSSSGVACYSPDGITWASGSGGTAIANSSIASNAAVCVTLSTTTSATYRYTLNGVTWLNGSLPISSYYSVYAADGVIYALSSYCNYASLDGVSWIALPYFITSIAKIGDTYYAFYGADAYCTSSDLVTWSTTKNAIAAPGNNSPSQFVVMGNILVGAYVGLSSTLSSTEWSTEYVGIPTAVTVGTFNSYVRVN